MKKIISMILVLIITFASACAKQSHVGNNKVLILTSGEDFKIEYLTNRVKEKFPNYDITIEYMTTGNLAAKILAEGASTDADIVWSIDYGYLDKIDRTGAFADLSYFDKSVFTDDVKNNGNYTCELRNGGCTIINPKMLEEKGLKEPTCYDDLIKPEYKGLISMPSPKSSGTGYMFLKSLVNAWGENKTYDYFEKLTENILQYTSSGSGPVNALLQGEAAIGLGMIAQTVEKINSGENLKIVFFEEGAPYSLYGNALIKGKETKSAAKEVFDFISGEYNYENNEKFFPEQIYKDSIPSVKNYPTNIKYADMSNDSIEEKERLLDKWTYSVK